MSAESATPATNLVNELVEHIQQFLAYEMENDSQLSEASKESLTVASECIEQAFKIQRKPASSKLLDIFKNHKNSTTNQTPHQQANQQQQQQPQQPNNPFANLLSGQNGNQLPQLIQSIAGSFLSQAVGGQPGSGGEQQQQQQQQQQQANQSAPSTTPTAPPSSTNPPRERKRASAAEKLAAESFKNQGNDYMKQDRYKEAYDCYTRAIEIDDNNAIYYSNRAAASSKLDDHHAALRDCEEAVQIDSSYSKAYGRMGLAYASLEDHRKAKEAYVKAVELDPNNESYRNNLRIAEEKLNELNNNNNAQGSNAGAGGVQNNMMSMLRSMMANPEVMQMAMRSLQDPRMQSLFNMGAGTGGGNTGAGAGSGNPE